MRQLLLCAALPLLMGAAPADEGPRKISLTIYNGDLALVQEVRRLDVPAGQSRLEFRDVSTGIRPETVALSGGGLSVGYGLPVCLHLAAIESHGADSAQRGGSSQAGWPVSWRANGSRAYTGIVRPWTLTC